MSASNGMILVVDDEPSLVLSMCEILNGENYEAIGAYDGEQALSIYREQREHICLILCDITMPKMTGLDVLKSGLVEFGYMPMVMITAHDDATRVTEAVRLGAIDYLVKPFSVAGLTDQLGLWVEIAKRRLSQVDPNGKASKLEALLRVKSAKKHQAG